ncbi:ATP-binding cassette domain-containing protein [Lachnospiraceae bacterium ZAX-1]
MSQISVNDLTFHYEGTYEPIFEHTTFQIDTDWKLGFVGRNGKGKTTFLKLLIEAGTRKTMSYHQNSEARKNAVRYEYSGSITAEVAFDYFPYEISTAQKQNNTISIIEKIQPDYELWQICRELNALQMEGDVLYRPFDTLSNGEQTKVLLAVLFSHDNYFLLIDEPTNHLDVETRKIVKNYLNTKKGFILVSHDQRFLDGCIDHVLVLNRVSITVEKGNFSSWWENKRRQDEFELSKNEKLKKEIRKLTASARQSAQWADKAEGAKIGNKTSKNPKADSPSRSYIGEQSRRMQSRRKNLEHRQQAAIEEKQDLLKNLEQVESLKIMPHRYHKETLADTKDFGISYGDNPIFSHMYFEIKQKDRIILQGKNGCGKSSLLKYIMQKAGKEDSIKENTVSSIQISGNLEIAGNVKISYVSQDTSHLHGTLKDYAKAYGIEFSLFLALLRKLDFERSQFEKGMEQYSEGQKKKVFIARSLCEQADLYLWDEPLNFIDIFSRMQVEQLILQYEPTMLIVEHDKAFADSVGTKKILFNKGIL